MAFAFFKNHKIASFYGSYRHNYSKHFFLWQQGGWKWQNIRKFINHVVFIIFNFYSSYFLSFCKLSHKLLKMYESRPKKNKEQFLSLKWEKKEIRTLQAQLNFLVSYKKKEKVYDKKNAYIHTQTIIINNSNAIKILMTFWGHIQSLFKDMIKLTKIMLTTIKKEQKRLHYKPSLVDAVNSNTRTY